MEHKQNIFLMEYKLDIFLMEYKLDIFHMIYKVLHDIVQLFEMHQLIAT